MNDDRIEVVRPERAVRASGFPVRIEHEVIDDKLAGPVKQLRQGLFAVRSFENILFTYGFPRHLAPFLA